MEKSFLILLVIVFFFPAHSVYSQSISTDPVQPVAGKKVTITFDSSQESQLGKFTDDLYAHTGVIIEGSTSWQHVIGDWGDNALQPKLVNKGNGIYQLEISPDIRTFYSVSGSEKIRKMAFVFRSSDGKKQTRDLFTEVYPEGLEISITSPARGAVLLKNKPVTISALSTMDADLSLKIGSQAVATSTGKTISSVHTFSDGGWTWIVAQATGTDKTVYDSAHVYVRPDVVTQAMPAGLLKGINYPSATSATLVLWAPGKEFVYVLGDFNNWELNDNYLMKKDGDYFWLEQTGLTSLKPYIFQYFIDGQVKIADPYTNQTSDPNDQYIPAVSYPGLVAYPSGKADGVASVLQTGQTPYNWAIANFAPVPPVDELVIYETLVRDFTEERTYKSVADKLDYLKELGVNVLELMPVNEFEGNISWGYNPSFYFAPDKYYGPKNELKKLVDEAHKRGIAVVIDMVLNHSYGQSPLVRMYWDSQNSRPSADNPWYNQQSNFQNPDAQWGYDFNHESVYTRQLVDSINSFWMKEFKVDGFRFDFTKGFSNTPYGTTDWGSAYDAARIANLKRMASEIWKRNNRALVIFEHLADNSEEKELSAYGILLWGNMSGSYGEAAKGNTSDLNWGLYTSRGWTNPHLVTYMESHDEERAMVKVLTGGNSEGSYNTRSLPTALDRMELDALFLLLLPGPKMIWQFGELGYDYSINTCENPNVTSSTCRLVPKPVLWSYFDQTNRKDVYKMYARLNYLKTNYEEFSAAAVNSGNLSGMTKWFSFSNGGNHAVMTGNFATSSQTVSLTFPKAGTWYDYFGKTTVSIGSGSQNITLGPGEFKLFTTRQMKDPFDPTAIPETEGNSGNLQIFPNPVREKTTVRAAKGLGVFTIRDLSGRVVFHKDLSGVRSQEISLGDLVPGIYFVQAGGMVEKLVKY